MHIGTFNSENQKRSIRESRRVSLMLMSSAAIVPTGRSQVSKTFKETVAEDSKHNLKVVYNDPFLHG